LIAYYAGYGIVVKCLYYLKMVSGTCLHTCPTGKKDERESKLQPDEVVNIIGQNLGYPVRIEVIPITEWEVNSRKRRMGDYQIKVLIKMFQYYEQYGFCGNSLGLSGDLAGPELDSLRPCGWRRRQGSASEPRQEVPSRTSTSVLLEAPGRIPHTVEL
jgi:hypothetical protein